MFAAMARTETPLFRRALALMALWCLLWAVIGYLNHAAVPSYDQRPGYLGAMQSCADNRLETARNGDLAARRPGRLEMRACTERIRAHYLAAEAVDHRQVSVATLIWALVPSVLLLLLAAFAEELRRLLRRPGRP